MFDVGFTEILLIGVVSLVVIGPERLPDVARTAGRWIGKMQRFVRGVKSDIASELESGDLKRLIGDQREQIDELRKMVKTTARDLESTTHDVVRGARKKLTEMESAASDDEAAADDGVALPAKSASPVKAVPAANPTPPATSASSEESASATPPAAPIPASSPSAVRTTAASGAGKDPARGGSEVGGGDESAGGDGAHTDEAHAEGTQVASSSSRDHAARSSGTGGS